MAAAQRNAENIHVVVRCRPLSAQEIADKVPPIARVEDEKKEVTIEVKSRNLTKTFTYDAVYGTSASQRDVYNGTVLPIVQEVLEGYNCTIFAYGQTGTGKTYTMEGNRDTEDTSQLDSKARLKASREAGVISRAINTIFEHLSKTSDEYTVKVSHLELYNEELYDLLDPDNKGLKIFEDPANPSGSITVRGLTEVNVYNPRDIFNVLEKSWNERTTAETKLNKESSRSHCIFSITIHMKERNIEGEDLLKVGKLNLVDLAGSENVGRSGMAQKTAGRQEAGMINKSLLAFGRVITALVDQTQHVPYRESKLTRLLQDSLGGRTKTCIIATISPASVSLDETIGTLEYAHRAKSIKNQPQVNAKLSKKEFLGDYAKEIDDIRSQLEAMRRKDGVYMPHEQYIHLSEDLKKKAEEIEILLEEKKTKEKEFEEIHEVFDLQAKDLKETQNTLIETQATLEGTLQELHDTIATLDATRGDLTEHKLVLTERSNVESKFHQEANILLSTLNDSLRDIDGLQAKIGREEELASLNNFAWADKKSDLSKKLKSNEELVQKFIDQQSRRFGELDGSLNAFLISKEGELNTLQSKMRDLSTMVNVGQKQMAELIDSRLVEEQAQRDAVKGLQANHVDTSSKLLSSLTESVEAKVSTLGSTIASYEQRTKTWSETRDNELKESVLHAHQFTEDQKQKIDKFRSQANSRLETEIASYAENRLKLTAFIDQQKTDTRDFQTKVLATLSTMLTEFVSRREQTLDGTLQTFLKSFDERVDEIAQFRGSVDIVADESIAHLSAFDKENASKKAAIIDSIKKMSEITSGISKINTDQARQITAATVAEVGKIKESNIANLRSVEERLAMMQEKMQQSSEEQKKQLLTLASEATANSSAIERHLVSSFDMTKTNIGGWSQEILSRKSEHAEFNSAWKTDVSKIGAEVSSFDLKRYNHTGASPSKKSWNYPTELTHSRPDAEIIAQFRNAGEFVPIIDPLFDAKRIAEASIKALPKEAKELEVAADLSSDIAESSAEASPSGEADVEATKPAQNPAAAPTGAAAAKPKPKPLHPVNTSGIARGNTKPMNSANIPVTRGPTVAAKPGLNGRENPRPAQPAANPTAKPALKRTNSQQQLVGAIGRKPAEVTNTLSKQQ